MLSCGRYIHLNFGHENDWRLREESQGHFKKLIEYVLNALTESGHSRRLSLQGLLLFAQGLGHKDSHTFLTDLWMTFGKDKSTSHEFAAQVVAAVVPTAALYSQAVATIVNYYLDDSQQAAREAIVKLADSKDPGAKDEVMKYVYEALRKCEHFSRPRLPLIIILSRLGPSCCWCLSNSHKRRRPRWCQSERRSNCLCKRRGRMP